MPRDGSNARKKSAHDLSRAEGIPYTEALRRTDAGRAHPGVRSTTPADVVTTSVTLVGHTSPVVSVALHPNGTELVSGGDVTARLWDLATGRTTRQISHESLVLSVALSPDGRTVAAGCENGTVSLWAVDTGEIVVLAVGPGPVRSVEFGPDGTTLATGSHDTRDAHIQEPTFRLWDLATRRVTTTLTRAGTYGHALAFHPDGYLLATSGELAGPVHLWDLGSGEPTLLAGHTGGANTVAFSHDGRTLATGSIDSTIRLWDMTTGKTITTLEPHAHYVIAVAFSPDDRTLATASVDSTIRLWDAGTGDATATLFGHRDFVNSLAFSSDGRTLVTGSMDATIRLWDRSG